MIQTILIWLVIMSVWAFLAMGIDKYQARRKGPRIAEKTLWILAVLGGGIGAYIGMQVFRHKTRKTTFRVGFLMLSIMYIAFILYLLDIKIPGLNQL